MTGACFFCSGGPCISSRLIFGPGFPLAIARPGVFTYRPYVPFMATRP